VVLPLAAPGQAYLKHYAVGGSCRPQQI